ncbi:MAG: TlpA family protein disulfide reductase [Saprospiraceae bacterium]|nr:TlpA family protein disulfide reductase [Saprospiraceae bacterium]
MKHFKIIYLLVLFAGTIAACGAMKGTSVSGKIANAGDMSIFLDRVGLNATNNVRLAAEKTGSDGSFSFSMPEGIQKGIYRITLGAKSLELISDGTEKDIVIDGDLNTLQNMEYKVTGSKLTEKFLAIIQGFVKKDIDIQRLTELAEKDSDPLVGFMIATRMFTFREEFAEIHTKVAARLADSGLDFAQEYQTISTSLATQAARRMAGNKIQLGMDAPEIALEGVDGKVRKLSSYKGKVVLIDFWASWCGPCRKANPHVVEIYNKYKNQGFDIFSVSLDGVDNRTRAAMGGDMEQIKAGINKSKERWIGAIAQDNLTWDGHVSDLMKWDSSAAGAYGVSSIPKTFLVGKDGKIAAIDPRYNLEEEILKVL